MNFRYYIVRPGGEIVGTDSILEWGAWYEEAGSIPGSRPFLEGGRRVAWTDLENGDAVSTVFLGMNHAFGSGPPILFETMIRRAGGYEEQWRYHTHEEALKGHEYAVRFAKGELTAEELALEDRS